MIFTGCYERFLFGFKTPDDLASIKEAALERRYTFAAHKNSVKCVAAAGNFLASGGADDTIHLYDYVHDKDLGFLMNPGEGAVPCLQFFAPSQGAAPTHMLTGSGDGAIVVWRAGGGWEHLKTMRGHKGAVNSLTLHPTGRLALSTARDGAIRMWDMLKGRCTYTTKLEAEGDLVRLGPSGDKYTLVCGKLVTIHSTSGEGGVLSRIELPSRVLCLGQQHDDVLLTGLEDGTVKLWDLRAPPSSGAMASIERAHASRIRGLDVVRAGGGKVPEFLATGSSDGVVKVWDTRMLGGKGEKQPAACVAQSATNARITCLCACTPPTKKAPAAAPAAAAAAGTKDKQPQQVQKAQVAKQQQQQPLKGLGARQVVGAAAVGQKGKQQLKQQKQQPVQQPEDDDDDEDEDEAGISGSDVDGDDDDQPLSSGSEEEEEEEEGARPPPQKRKQQQSQLQPGKGGPQGHPAKKAKLQAAAGGQQKQTGQVAHKPGQAAHKPGQAAQKQGQAAQKQAQGQKQKQGQKQQRPGQSPKAGGGGKSQQGHKQKQQGGLGKGKKGPR